MIIAGPYRTARDQAGDRPAAQTAQTEEDPMSIRSTLLATAFTLSSLGLAHANGLRPMEGQSVNLGDVSGVAYYTVQPDGFRVVTTLAQGEAGTPIRFVSVLAPGQRVVLSTPQQAGVLEIIRNEDSLVVRKANVPSD
jgi:hypothetical protein